MDVDLNALMQEIDDEWCSNLEHLEEVLEFYFPSLNRCMIENRPTDSGRGRTWFVMLTLKSGHSSKAVKSSLASAIRHCISKLFATIHEVPRGSI